MEDPYGAMLIAIVAGIFSTLSSALREALLLFNLPRLEDLYQGNGESSRFNRYIADQELMSFTASGVQCLSNVVLVLALDVWTRTVLGATVPFAWTFLGTLAVSIVAIYLFNALIPGPVVRWNSERVLFHGLRFLYPLRYLFLPPYRVLDLLKTLAARALGRDPEHAARQEIFDEIESAAEEGEREGVLEQAGTMMIKRVIRLRDLQVEEIMTPRTDIRSVPLSATIDEAARLALEVGHSRIPVYQENLDKVVGFFYVKDLLNHWGQNDRENITLEAIMRKPTFVPENKRVLDLLREFRKSKTHIAISLDEYGGTAGLISIEDILEEIVGEIEDEYDQPTEKPLKMIDERVAEVDAKLHIDELNDALHTDLPESEDFETIGGFIFSTLGKIPNAGETFVHGNLRFTILDAEERRINRVAITVLDS